MRPLTRNLRFARATGWPPRGTGNIRQNTPKGYSALRELRELGVAPVKPVEPPPVQVPAETPEESRAPAHTIGTPSGYTVPRISRRSYDKEALEADILEGTLKASTLADKCGIEVSTVYQIKSVMKKEGRLDSPAPVKKLHEVTELSDDLPEEFAPEEEEEISDEDDPDEDASYDPLAYRGKVAGSAI